MRVPNFDGGGGSALELGGPVVIVLVVLVLGATIFLRRARYLRRIPAYVMIACLVAALAVLAFMRFSS